MNVFQIIYGDTPDIIIPCLESVKKIYPQAHIIRIEKTENPIMDSDIFRIDMLSGQDNILYLDWDIFLEKELNLTKNNQLCCSFYKKSPDLSIIYSPNHEIWKDFEKERIRRNISKKTYGWPRKILRNMKINEITEGFKHLSYSGRRTT